MSLSIPKYFEDYTAKNGHGPINTSSTAVNGKLRTPLLPIYKCLTSRLAVQAVYLSGTPEYLLFTNSYPVGTC